MTAHATSLRLRRRLGIAAAALAVVAAIGWFGLRAGVALVQRQVIAALGPGAEVARLDASWNAVELIGLRIPGEPGWPTPDALRAERVRIVPSWRSLLSDEIEISRIEVTGAFLSALRTRDAGLQVVPSLLAERIGSRTDAAPASASAATRPSRRASIGAIQIDGGVLEIHDATVATPPWKTRLEDIGVTLSGVEAPDFAGAMPFALTALLDGPARKGKLDVAGWLDASTRDLSLTVSLAGADLLALEPYFVKETKVRLASGALDLHLDAQVRARELRAPGRLTLSHLAFAGGGSATSQLFGVPRDLLLASLRARGGRITLDFSLDGNIDDPKFRLNEVLATRVAVQLAKELGFSVGGLVEGVGGLGLEGLEGAGKAAGGIGSALRKLVPHVK